MCSNHMGRIKLTPTKQSVMQSRSFVEGEELELVTQFKHLGSILDSNLTFIQNILKVTNTKKIQFIKPQTN